MITVTRQCELAVGNVIKYHSRLALIKEITPTFILLEIDDIEMHVSMESFAVSHGSLFTMDVDVESV